MLCFHEKPIDDLKIGCDLYQYSLTTNSLSCDNIKYWIQGYNFHIIWY